MLLSKHQFLSRFTPQEKADILLAGDTNPLVRVYLFDLNASDEVDICLQQTIDGVTLLEAAGLIATGRASEILSSGESHPAPIGTARILAPFDAPFPDTYPIDSFNAATGVYTILGTEFDQQFVEVLT